MAASTRLAPPSDIPTSAGSTSDDDDDTEFGLRADDSPTGQQDEYEQTESLLVPSPQSKTQREARQSSRRASSPRRRRRKNEWWLFGERLRAYGGFLLGKLEMHSVGEFMRTMACRMYYSQRAKYVYGGVLLLSFVLLTQSLWMDDAATNGVLGVLMFVAELFVTFMLNLEVTMRILILGRDFFRQRSNVFDLALAVSCVVLLVLGHLTDLDDTLEQPVEDLFLQSLMLFRYGVQLLCIVTIWSSAKRPRLPEDDIDFTRMAQISRRKDDAV